MINDAKAREHQRFTRPIAERDRWATSRIIDGGFAVLQTCQNWSQPWSNLLLAQLYWGAIPT